MAILNTDNLIGSIIPNIYIQKITLENTIRDKQDNSKNSRILSHVDKNRLPYFEVNLDYGNIEVTRSRDTNEYLQQSNNSSNDSFTTVTIDLCLKEKIDNDGQMSWFDNKDLLRFLKVLIIRSTHKESTAILSQYNDFDRFLYNFKFYSGFLAENNLTDITIPINYVIKDKDITNFESYDVQDNKIYNIPIRHTDTIASKSVKHLSYFIVTVFDVESLINIYDLDLKTSIEKKDTSKAIGLGGRVASELVIDDYKISSQNFVFIDESGVVWNGAVERRKEQLYAVDSSLKKDKKLSVEAISNSKIQDFRKKELILDRPVLDRSLLEKKVFSNLKNIKFFNNNDIISKEKQSCYFSELYLSRDNYNTCRFFFSIDFIKIIRENTFCGKFFTYDKTELLNNVLISSIKIIRDRIPNEYSNNIKISKDDIIKFDNNYSHVSVGMIGESEPFKMSKYNSKNGSLQEIELWLPNYDSEYIKKEYYDQNGVKKIYDKWIGSTDGIRHFTGIDKIISSNTFGLYRYGIEIEILDKTLIFFKQLSDKLKNANNILIGYLNEATQKINYDSLSGRFKKEYVDKLKEQYKGREKDAPWILPISNYIESLVFFSDSNELKIDEIEEALFSYINPDSGNASGIELVIGVINDLVYQIDCLYKSNNASKESSYKNSVLDSKVVSKDPVPKRTYKIKYYFEQKFDSEIDNNVGYDFLFFDKTNKEQNNDGLAVFSKAYIDERIINETYKFFKNQNTDINLNSRSKTYTVNDNIDNSKYSFLTPCKINVGKDVIINSSTNNKNKNINIEKYIKILHYNYFKHKESISSFWLEPNINDLSNNKISEQKMRFFLNDIFNNKSCTIEGFDSETLRSQENLIFDNTENKTNTLNFFDSNNAINKNDIYKEQLKSINKNSSLQLSTFNANSFLLYILELKNNDNDLFLDKKKQEEIDKLDEIIKYNLQQDNNFIDELEDFGLTKEKNDENMISKEKQEIIKNLPNQIKSLFLESISPDKVVNIWVTNDFNPLKDPIKKIEFNIKFNTIVQVEILAGFSTKKNNNIDIAFLKNPVWIKLDKNLYDSAMSEGKMMLCRIRRYENKSFGVQKSELLDLPFLNEYFFISPISRIFDKQNPYNEALIGKLIYTINGKLIERYFPIKTQNYNSELSTTLLPSAIEDNLSNFTNTVGSSKPKLISTIEDEEKQKSKDLTFNIFKLNPLNKE